MGSPRQTNAASTQSRASLTGIGHLEDQTSLANPDLKTSNKNKSFNLSHSHQQLYSKSHTAIKTVPATDTPKKRKISATGLYHNSDVDDERSSKSAKMGSTPGQPSKRKRKTKGPPIQQRAIPRSFDECDKADQLLITLRDKGSDWDEIVVKWKALTGEHKVGKSTLPNRYNRLKENFSVIRDEDSARLIEAKREIEVAFENTKWAKIATLVRRKGGDEYLPVVLQRQYKKLMLGVGACPPPGVRDPDFDGVDPLPPSPDPRDDDGVSGKGKGSGKVWVRVSEGEEGSGEEDDGEEEEDEENGEDGVDGEDGGDGEHGEADVESDA